MSSQLFISKRDIIWPDNDEAAEEVPQPAAPKQEEGGEPKKKKKKKKTMIDFKMYPKHEYRYPSVGYY